MYLIDIFIKIIAIPNTNIKFDNSIFKYVIIKIIILTSSATLNANEIFLNAKNYKNIEYVIIISQNISEKKPQIDNHKIILNDQTKKNAMTKYYILFLENKMKTTNIKYNSIIKIKIMNEIQHIKIYKKYDVVFYIIIFLYCKQNNIFYFKRFK